MAPTNFSWALEMHVEDPDGNVLRLGSELRSAPFVAAISALTNGKNNIGIGGRVGVQ